MFSNILNSATKLVLISLAAVLEVAFVAVVLNNLTSEDVATAIITLFAQVITAVIAFYFGQKYPNTTNSTSEQQQGNTDTPVV